MNTVQVQRGALAAQELGVFDEYLEIMLKAMWEEDKNLSDLDVLQSTMNENNLDAEAIIKIVTSQ